MYYAITKYDENKNPIMTSLFNINKINCVDDVIKQNHFLIAKDGWHSTDEMIKFYLKKGKQYEKKF